MLQAPSSEFHFRDSTSSEKSSTAKPVPYRRGHAHKRSAAISGDFDIDFFSGPSSINQTSSSTPYNYPSLPKSFQVPYSSSPSPPSNMSTPPTTPKNNIKSPILNMPKLLVNDVDQAQYIPPLSQKNSHHRLNSWAHSNLRYENRPQSPNVSSSLKGKNIYETPKSSNNSTPDMPHSSVCTPYQIPEPSIDLDLAMGVYHDPASSIPTSMKTSQTHRRTESAPELEDFLKYKVFSNHLASPVKNTSAIFEEEEDDDDNDDNLSSTSSDSSQENSFKHAKVKTLVNKQNNSSNISLSSNTSSSYHSFMSTPSQTPTSLKFNTQQQRRSGASAARYQNYYTNSALLSHALKSSESLVMQNKPSISSLENYSNNVPSSVSVKSSLSSSSSYYYNNSSSAFKFQSRVYEPASSRSPQQQQTSFNSPTFSESISPLQNSTSTLLSTPSLTTPTPVKSPLHIPSTISKNKSVSSTASNNSNSNSVASAGTKSPIRTHKKSNSLLSSLTSRIRGGSISSSSVKSQPLYVTKSETGEEEEEGDITVTPYNMDESTPQMTPKMGDRMTNIDLKQSIMSPVGTISGKEDVNKTPSGKKKRFFKWIKK